MLVARRSEVLDRLPLHEVSPAVEERLQYFFERKWGEGKLTELWMNRDVLFSRSHRQLAQSTSL